MSEPTDSQCQTASGEENQSQPSLLSVDETSSEDDDSDASSVGSPDTSQDDPDQSLFGRWPRRLVLHVDKQKKTLTSHEWEPDNIYGGTEEPKYNAISYTWGRFKLKRWEKRHVQAVDIKGVSWAIPRIDPDKHFSAGDFLSTIITACDAPEFNGRGNVEFIWLDVACIDQENYRIKMLEVGRQAVIFQHAEVCCVWLASSPVGRSERLAMDLWEASRAAPAANRPRNDPAHKAALEQWQRQFRETTMDNVDYIIEKEPWFTSLWTLQEAFLCQRANLIAGDGSPVPLRKGLDFERPYATLRDVSLSVSQITRVCERSLSLKCQSGERIQLLLARIGETGLKEVLQRNPFQLLKAASFRKVYDKLDRVYGIMQIFGFKLGASKQKAGTKRSGLGAFRPLRRRLKLSDLELEFSQRIIEAYPVQSQLSVFTSVPEPGHAWRVSSTMEVTYIARTSSLFLWSNGRGPGDLGDGEKRQESLCKFSTTQDLSISRRNLDHFQRGISVIRNIFHGPVTWCHFSGKTCPLATLRPIWSWLNKPENRYGPSFTYTCQEIALDLQRDPRTSKLSVTSIPELPLDGFEVHNGEQDDVITKLIKRLQAPEPLVLCLGSIRRQTTDDDFVGKTFYGLLLVSQRWRGLDYWRRIGVVSWDAFDFPRDLQENYRLILQVRSDKWEEKEGMYG